MLRARSLSDELKRELLAEFTPAEIVELTLRAVMSSENSRRIIAAGHEPAAIDETTYADSAARRAPRLEGGERPAPARASGERTRLP